MPEWSEPFLEVLRTKCDATAASKAAGVARSTAYAWKKDNDDFAEAWKDAVDEALDNLEAEAYRRATEGCDKPIYQKGMLVGTVREFSDTLAIFMLKAKRRDQFGDHVRTEQKVNVTGELALEIAAKAAKVYGEETT